MQPGLTADRNTLANLLWDARSDSASKHCLRQCLVELKKVLEPISPQLLRVSRHSIALDAELIDVDVHRIERLANAGPDTGANDFLYELRGEFLEQFDVGAENFADWVAVERRRVNDLLARIYEAAAIRLADRGDAGSAISIAERLTALDPLREDWQRLLIGLYANRYGRGRALSYARSVIHLLRKELEIEPDQKTTALIERLKASSPYDAPALTFGD